MNENYANKLKEIIDKLDYKPRLLLHSCCAPCSSYVITYLYDYFDITILYYNPNIYPYEEYKKRKDEQIRLISNFKGVKIINCDYDNDIYNEVVKGLENEPERGSRCTKCFYLRLNKTGEIAKKNDFEYFGTTLTVSPYKTARLLNEIGEDISKKYDIKWLYSDFKKNDGYKKSIELSKKYDLYRQDYCGCIYSKRDK
ncbi:MAG: epoxyqueuosine reductase QueH [Bacilli bacterium]|nr:epoxyqueuosine reductase QueH [Bacilli bacterium]